MAFGFGFNKAKVLASAERNVKQGKLQNAIADYEKIVKEDPRDLTVLNTIGDLYARVGRPDQAIASFKRVGDAYAGDGFTVKAIAMYKKLVKLSPHSTDALIRLAELYTQQGLYNDARYQYTQVAETYLRNNDPSGAVEILQKMLDLDPENATLQTRLADIYARLGKKAEARDLYFRVAQALRSRGSLAACDEALGRLLQIDPEFTQGLLLRGQVKLDAGEAEGAIRALEALPDVDSRAEALKVLLRANLKLGRTAEAEPLARKLLHVFQDVSGVTAYGDALIASGECEAALRFYREHADRLLAANAPVLMETLHTLIARIRDSAPSLEIVHELFQRTGSTTHLAEVMELLAHAYVQQEELTKARDLYYKLAELEPENPLHIQNYKQIVARLGQDVVSRELSAEERAQAFLVDELEQDAPAVEQSYGPELQATLKNALTEAELFASYNLPARAIPPLETVLPQAPQDVQVNQRLASLYARIDRFAEAAARCEVLRSVYAEAGKEQQAQDYAHMAGRYRQRAELKPGSPVETAPAAPVSTQEPAPAVSDAPEIEPAADAVIDDSSPAFEAQAETIAAAADADLPVTPAESEPLAHEIDLSQEIDLSEEWDLLASEQNAPAGAEAAPDRLLAAAAPGETSVFDFSTVAAQTDSVASAIGDATAGDALEETRFYISQAMLEEARAALARAEALAPSSPACAELRVQLEQLAGRVAPTGDGTRAGDDAGELSLEAEEIPGDLASITRGPLAADASLCVEERAVACGARELPAAESSAQLISSHGVTGEQPLELELALENAPAEVLAATAAADEVLGDSLFGHSAAEPQMAVPPASVPPGPPLDLSDGNSDWLLADVFDEFKQELESGNGDSADPETHYNMGVAFKDMGLLDEAIGEFQKVCQVVEKGQPFAQALETYTWLADCFLQKGVPEAGIRWYGKALDVPNLGADRALAIQYELACAHQAAGDNQAALRHFMEVYGANIDYRDIAERIKALKS